MVELMCKKLDEDCEKWANEPLNCKGKIAHQYQLLKQKKKGQAKEMEERKELENTLRKSLTKWKTWGKA